MDEQDTIVLDRVRSQFILDLQPKYILKDLSSCGIISEDQKRLILEQSTEEEQVAALFKVLQKSTLPRTLELLENSLRSDEAYVWLADQLIDEKQKCREIGETVRRLLTKGGVPQLPNHVLRRPILLKDIKLKLQEIFAQYSGWVVIHGMAGSGKSLAAAAVLRDIHFVTTICSQGIFWIKIGSNISEDNLLNKIHTLCEKLNDSYRGNIPSTLEQATDRLRQLFCEDDFSRSLLVLDDVWDDYVIRCFDFGCRVLVTTRDRSIMDVAASNVSYVAINEGFTLKECKQFFADSLQVKLSDLPASIEDIREHTRGCPLVMAIISANVRQYPTKYSQGFRRCLSQLKDNSLISVSKRSSYDYNCISKALEMSVESLGALKEYFYDLAIFPQDCYISGQVLCILWRKDEFQVDDIMNIFVDKSVVIKIPNGHKYNLYSIHDLFVSYLKDTKKSSFPVRTRLIQDKTERVVKRVQHGRIANRFFGLRMRVHHTSVEVDGAGESARPILQTDLINENLLHMRKEELMGRNLES